MHIRSIGIYVATMRDIILGITPFTMEERVGITVNSNGKSIAEECEQQTEQTNVLTAINNDASEKQKIPNKNKLNNHCSHSTGNDPCMSVK